MKKLLTLLALAATTLSVSAQRVTDKLDRGLIGIPVTNGIFVSWRIQADEYYDVKYNLYRDGQKIAENLNVSNYTDASGSTTSTYQVAAVINGQEQAKCAAVTPWAQSYFEITPKHDSSLKCTYVPNDGECADVDGDGQVEILLKYNNQEESSQLYPKAGPTVNDVSTYEYTLFEVLKLDGTVLWWVNCGPNMGDFQNNEQNIVGYDWDQDGKAEVVMRLEEGSQVHMADGTVYTIGADGKNGTSWTNYREPKSSGSVEWFTHYGNEFLFYCEGATGKPYQCITYPLKRLEDGETDLNAAWGDGYGHRSSKFFFGAPYLDGRHPSIFLGRGIYTRHKFIAYDVDPSTHALTQRWYWSNNQKGSPWYGNGYHNYAVVDVDWDGRDEIVWGSMVIDDNGKGLSTTGLGHGDAQHHGDFDPYTYGQEGFFCNEDEPANNYRDLTTAKIYHRVTGSNDDGRAIAGQFCNDYPGAMGFSAHDVAISCVTGDNVGSLGKTGVSMNFRCYWDGDLEEESFDGGGDGGNGHIYKYGNSNAIQIFDGSISNNSTKSTPTFMGDILGDWREEFIMRDANNHIRIYSTTTATANRNYSLWYDKQYRNGMVWEPCGYNQPPHASYYLGDLEGITAAPPAETMTGRTEVANGGTISNSGEQVITCETNDMTVKVAEGATPYIYIDNAPSWVQGYAPSETTMSNTPSNITYSYYTHTLTGGAFTGDMRLVKQGAGTLVLPNVTETYTGKTEVWAGSLSFDGTLQNSKLWLNRLTALNSDGGTFSKGIQADYGSVIRPGGVNAKASSITTDTLSLGFGAVCELDIYSDGNAADQLNANVLTIEKKVWPYGGGPAYDSPVFRINAHAATGEETIADGKYCLGTIGEVIGSIDNIVIEGLQKQKASLSYNEGKLYIDIVNFVGEPVTWIGVNSSAWDLDNTKNFKNEKGDTVTFVTGSSVTFDDTAAKTTVSVGEKISPSQIIFNNGTTKPYTFTGDSIIGGAQITKSGSGTVTINNVNRVGNTTINSGIIAVKSLASSAVGNDYGSLGGESSKITIADGARLQVTASTTSNQSILIGAGGNGTIDVASGATLTQTKAIGRTGTAAATLTKKGTGALTLPSTMTISKLIIAAGTVSDVEYSNVNKLPATVEFQGGTLYDSNSEGSSTTTSANFIVPEGKTGTLYLDPRCNYTGTLTGAGTFTVYAAGVRNYLNGNWSNFEGELVVMGTKRGTYDPSFDWNNTYGLGKAILNVPAGYEFKNNGKNVAIKALKSASTASGTLSGTGTYTIGEGYNGNITLYNKISSPVIYEGEQGYEMRITNAQFGNLNSTLAVRSGAVRLTGSSSSSTCAVGNNLITVSGTGKVYGSYGYIYSLTANSGGTFSCTSNTDGATTFRTASNVIVNSGGTIDFKIASATSNSKLTCGGNLTLNTGSTVKIRLADGFTPAIGKSYTLWTVKGTFTGNKDNVTLDLPFLTTADWDTSDLFTSGVLKVVETTGVKGDVNGDEKVDVQDVNCIIANICGTTKFPKADVNNDGKVDYRDVNSVLLLITKSL